jgi:hypothetical protein
VARTDSALLKAVLDKTGLTRQGVVDRRNRLRKLVPMPPDIATAVVAHRANVDISRFMDEESVRVVGEYDERVHNKEGGAAAALPAPPKQAKAKGKAPSEIAFPNFKIYEGGLSDKQLKDLEKMARRVYPLLYAFENSVREFVNGHLTAAYGEAWWHRPHLVKKSTRESVARIKKQQGEARWVERKSAPEINYTMLGQLADIMLSNDGWKVFEPIFKKKSWVEDRVTSLEIPRNVMAHMNPLMEKNIKGLEVRAQEWFDQIKGHSPPM